MNKNFGLSKFKNISIFFSEKSDGNLANAILGNLCDKESVLKNRIVFLEKCGIDIDKCVCMWVVHGDQIEVADPKDAGISMRDFKRAVKLDGLMTDKKGLFLFLLVADCLPVILYDPVKEAICLIHAGWKGVDLEIVKKAVGQMASVYKSDPKDLVVEIGPHVHKKSFVKESPSQKDDPRWKPFVEKLDGVRYAIDLSGFVISQLVDSGVLPENIFISNIDTAVSNNYFSHVRDAALPVKEQGRFACIVGLKP